MHCHCYLGSPWGTPCAVTPIFNYINLKAEKCDWDCHQCSRTLKNSYGNMLSTYKQQEERRWIQSAWKLVKVNMCCKHAIKISSTNCVVFLLVSCVLVWTKFDRCVQREKPRWNKCQEAGCVGMVSVYGKYCRMLQGCHRRYGSLKVSICHGL